MPLLDTPPSEQLPRIVRLALRAAEHLGYEARIVDPAYGYLFQVSDGRKQRYFVGGLSPLNDAVGARLAQDKFYTAMILAERGFRVTNGVRCIRPGYFKFEDFSDHSGVDAGIQHANRVGYPVIVKPNRMALGRDVVAVYDEPSLIEAIETVWKADYIALVQEVARGADVRLDFLDGSFLAGYRRRPVAILGDGRRDIRTLLCDLDRRFGDDDFFGRRRSEPLWEQIVTARGWDERSVLSLGEALSFENPVLNLNRWATAEVLDDVPDSWLRYCLSVAEVLHLRHFGLDLRVPVPGDGSGWKDAEPASSVIIEVNASPALVQLHELGYRQKAIHGQARVLRALFEA
jgi:glutathione synthase/RimK-type ligase-like ATP-grasp enzyme